MVLSSPLALVDDCRGRTDIGEASQIRDCCAVADRQSVTLAAPDAADLEDLLEPAAARASVQLQETIEGF